MYISNLYFELYSCLCIYVSLKQGLYYIQTTGFFFYLRNLMLYYIILQTRWRVLSVSSRFTPVTTTCISDWKGRITVQWILYRMTKIWAPRQIFHRPTNQSSEIYLISYKKYIICNCKYVWCLIIKVIWICYYVN